MKKGSRITTGRIGEDLALQYLLAQGYTLVERNYRKRSGEIDLVVRDGEFLVFVEVKSRRSARYGSPFEAVDLRKQRQISKVALAFMVQHKCLEVQVRFDVVAVFLGESVPRVELIQNAFEFCG